MKVTGLIKKVGEVEQVSDKFKKREVWIETERESNYPQMLNIQLNQENADKFNLAEGQEAELEINLRGRIWTNGDGKQKCFNSIECWKWSALATEPIAATEEDDLAF